jgi:glycosyltransferase involved in cell wall biosynthesis
MANNNPYIIRHFRLDQFESEEKEPLPEGANYYFTFWWKQICIGQLFLPSEEFSIHKFRTRLISAVAPAIRFYCQEKGIPVLFYEEAIINGHYQDLYMEFDRVFTPDIAGEVGDNIMGTKERDLSISMLPEISVIICTRNRPASLQRCLLSIFAQVRKPAEIIVVDNAPTDEGTRLLVEQYPEVRYICEPRGGLSIARNAGLRVARTPIVAFTDDDVSVHPYWLNYVQECFLDPRVAAMTGLVIPSELETQSQQRFEKEWSFNNGYTDKIFGTGYFHNNLATGPKVWEIGAGANMAFRLSVFNDTGLFDERLGAGAAGCSEDSELWFRILARGFEIHYNPRAAVFHVHRKELKALHSQIFSYMRGHAAAALIQEGYEGGAHYRKYLFRKVMKGYLPLILKKMWRAPYENKLLLIQLRGLLSGVLFFILNKNKPSQSNV